MNSPPQALLPSLDEHLNLYGELRLQYPLNEGLLLVIYGHLFRAVLMLRVILHDIAVVIFDGENLNSLPADKWLCFRD